MLLNNNQDLFLVCVGGGNFDEDEQNLLKSLSIQKKVLRFDVNDGKLGYLYKNALAFVFPSLYEGFGLPIVEAFACKCPVVLNNASCFPELAADSAEYFDPSSIESMRKAIEKVINNYKLRQKLIKRGLERVKDFSWEKTAKKTKKVYQSVI